MQAWKIVEVLGGS